MKKKYSTESDKQGAAVAAMLGFLGLLNAVSVSPVVLEFCTPGHKAGRGFKRLLSARPAGMLITLREEVQREL